MIAWAPTVNLVAPWNGTIPKGPGMWYSAPGIPPIGISMATARTWLLDSTSQFRPAPPPAYGSPAWQAALEEVRRVARERTPEQTKIAQKWNDGDPWAAWNETASAAIRRHHMSDADAARVLAVLNIAALDAVTACFEAKYHYWSIRPSQADTTLVLADSVDLPNFPSYPSGHACSAGAFDGVLGHYFPMSARSSPGSPKSRRCLGSTEGFTIVSTTTEVSRSGEWWPGTTLSRSDVEG